jgi:hypothetical protein
MMNRTLASTLLLVVAFSLLVGCNSREKKASADKKTAAAAKKQDDHTHGTGPHGGVVSDLGGGKYHFEFTVKHPEKEAIIYILGGDAKTPAPIKADKLTLSIKEPSFQVELKARPEEKEPSGMSSRFVGVHEKLGKEQEFEGTVSVVVDGTPYAGDFKEEPETPAKK